MHAQTTQENSAAIATVRRILGIDPGLRVTGYAVIEGVKQPHVVEAGVLRSQEGREKLDLPQRLRALHEGLLQIIEEYRPSVVVLEQLYSHYKHPQTAIKMAHARGALMLAAGLRGLPVVNYTATRIKRTITGSGRATKGQVQRSMQRELGLAELPKPADVADALAIALCHFYIANGSRLG